LRHLGDELRSRPRDHGGGNGGLVGLDDDGLLDRCLALRRWGRRSETYLFGSRQGEKDRFGPLADGAPYDLVFLFEAIGYNFEPSELGAAMGSSN